MVTDMKEYLFDCIKNLNDMKIKTKTAYKVTFIGFCVFTIAAYIWAVYSLMYAIISAVL